MVKGKARAAGSFLGGLLNNPAVVILGGLAIVLLIFRGNISQAFADVGKSISGGLGDINIQLPEIKLPEISLPDITFPEFNFPEFKFPDFNFPDLFEQGGITPPAQDPAGDPELSIGLAGGIQERRRDLERALAEKALQEADIPLRDIGDQTIGLSPAQRFAFIERGVIPTGFQVVDGQLIQEAAPTNLFNQGGLIEDQKISSFLLGDIGTTPFVGGGVSFVGGSVFETPIANLSLSQIIDRFMVTASQAADIRAQAIGFTPEEELFLQGSGDIFGFTGFNPAAVSDSQFQGLTAEEIALRLTGGNISNF